MTTQLELGQAARDTGTEQVKAHGPTWHELACEDFEAFLDFFGPSTANEWRRKRTEHDQPQPHHPNAWGAVVIALAKTKRIHWTGEIRQARSKSRHCGFEKVWRV